MAADALHHLERCRSVRVVPISVRRGARASGHWLVVTTENPPPDPLRPSRAVARVEMMAEALGVCGASVHAVVRLFPTELSSIMALTVDPHTGAMGIQTRCAGKQVCLQVARLMEDAGAEEASIRRLLTRAKHFEYRGLLVRVWLGPGGTEGVGYQFEQPSEVVVAHAWLSDGGVRAEGIALMEAMAEVLSLQQVCRIGTSVYPHSSRIDTVRFALPPVADSWDCIQAAVRLVGLEDRDFAPVVAHRTALSDKATAVSLDFRNQRAQPGLGLEVEQVHPMVVESVLDGASAGDEAADRARLPMELSGHQAHSRVRFRLAPGVACRVATTAITLS